MSHQHPQQLVQCAMQRQLDVERGLHRLACQEIVLVKETQEHVHQYGKKDIQEIVHDIQRELAVARLENEQLKLDGLRQRKQNSILRLKLASTKEDVDLLQRNMALLDQHSQHLVEDIAGLRNSLAAATQQLTDVSAAKAMLQADAERHMGEALQASMELTRLHEDLKLTTGRLNTSTGQAADLLQQLKSVQAENASLMSQLALSQGRDTEAAAAHSALKEALDGMRSELRSLRERLSAEEVARVAAEACAAKSAAAAVVAADALTAKEQQVAAWRDLEQASKATASQHMQLTQVQLDSMHQRATATEAKLLEQLGMLQQQLDRERSARCAAEASNTVSVAKAGAEHASLEKELVALREEVSQGKAHLAAAKAAAAKEAKRAATLQQDLEHLQEQATRAAVHTVDELVGDLTQGQETEDDTEQPSQLQQRSQAAAAAAGKRATAAAAKRKQGRPRKAVAAAAAATPLGQTAVFEAGPAAELSEIEEGDEEQEAEDMSQQQAVQHSKQQRQQQRRKAEQQEESGYQHEEEAGGGRRPRSAKSRAQQHIKAAAAADATPPNNDAAAEFGDDDVQEQGQQQLARRVSPRSKGNMQAGARELGSSQPVPSAAASPDRRVVQQAAQEKGAVAMAPSAAAAPGPPPLSFVPQSVTTPAAALKSTEVMKAAAERLSAASMLKKLNQGVVSQAGKPGARKRKLGAAAGGGSMDVLPTNLIMSTGFKPPKVRHLG